MAHRVSRYDPQFCELLLEYFESAAASPVRDLAPVTIETADTKGVSQKTEVRRICGELPTIEGFARSVGIPSSTIRTWPSNHPEFADAYTRAQDIQKALLIDRGLTRQYDSTAFMFVAKNITDMKDKIEQAHTGGDGKPFEVIIRDYSAKPTKPKP